MALPRLLRQAFQPDFLPVVAHGVAWARAVLRPWLAGRPPLGERGPRILLEPLPLLLDPLRAVLQPRATLSFRQNMTARTARLLYESLRNDSQ